MALTAQCPLLEIHFSIRFSSIQSRALCVLHRARHRLSRLFSVGRFPGPGPESGRLTLLMSSPGSVPSGLQWEPVYGRDHQDGDYRSEGKEVSALTPTLHMAVRLC